ncbi:hypothetical protein EXIGLDRAFT_721815 [Exidia glandulosa HHB12029]|uniref:Uncharacterized protein n=1 Tax=Exidia glandulosa HHB12029 TaxID=1314781 RepID=A0A165QHN4_EXIGL|nr:hypothetical protein EXIGLDRAFT_721815 [Exidia glandulosa HHB12029]
MARKWIARHGAQRRSRIDAASVCRRNSCSLRDPAVVTVTHPIVSVFFPSVYAALADI